MLRATKDSRSVYGNLYVQGLVALSPRVAVNKATWEASWSEIFNDTLEFIEVRVGEMYLLETATNPRFKACFLESLGVELLQSLLVERVLDVL